VEAADGRARPEGAGGNTLATPDWELDWEWDGLTAHGD
jgi:hypothetical protein